MNLAEYLMKTLEDHTILYDDECMWCTEFPPTGY